MTPHDKLAKKNAVALRELIKERELKQEELKRQLAVQEEQEGAVTTAKERLQEMKKKVESAVKMQSDKKASQRKVTDALKTKIQASESDAAKVKKERIDADNALAKAMLKAKELVSRSASCKSCTTALLSGNVYELVGEVERLEEENNKLRHQIKDTQTRQNSDIRRIDGEREALEKRLDDKTRFFTDMAAFDPTSNLKEILKAQKDNVEGLRTVVKGIHAKAKKLTAHNTELNAHLDKCGC